MGWCYDTVDQYYYSQFLDYTLLHLCNVEDWTTLTRNSNLVFMATIVPPPSQKDSTTTVDHMFLYKEEGACRCHCATSRVEHSSCMLVASNRTQTMLLDRGS